MLWIIIIKKKKKKKSATRAVDSPTPLTIVTQGTEPRLPSLCSSQEHLHSLCSPRPARSCQSAWLMPCLEPSSPVTLWWLFVILQVQLKCHLLAEVPPSPAPISYLLRHLYPVPTTLPCFILFLPLSAIFCSLTCFLSGCPAL